jgi:putative two-component system response regulator
VAVADTFDALLSHRPYRPAYPAAEVAAILTDGAGRQWDPRVVRALLACVDELHAIRAETPVA